MPLAWTVTENIKWARRLTWCKRGPIFYSQPCKTWEVACPAFQVGGNLKLGTSPTLTRLMQRGWQTARLHTTFPMVNHSPAHILKYSCFCRDFHHLNLSDISIAKGKSWCATGRIQYLFKLLSYINPTWDHIWTYITFISHLVQRTYKNTKIHIFMHFQWESNDPTTLQLAAQQLP